MSNLDQRTMLELVFGEQEGNIVVGLMDRAGPKGQLNRSWDFHWPSQADDVVNFFNQHVTSDAYFSPLVYGDMRDEATGRLRRVPENAISSQVIYQDSDECPPDKFLVTPSIHVQTSSAHGQDYWLLDAPIPAEEAALISRKIATRHKQDGSDPSSWSANKFMRALATNTRHGFPEQVTATTSGEMYSTEDMNAKYGAVEVDVQRPIARMIDNYVDSDQDLPDFAESVDSIPREEYERLGLEGLVFGTPPDGRRSEMRYRLLAQLFRVNPEMEFDRILAIAWHAPASQKWRDDPRNIRGLIFEAQKAQTEIAYERGVAQEAPDAGELLSEIARVERPKVGLLTDAERTLVAHENHFIPRYETWSAAKLGAAHNAPYARMNAWSVLSCAFADLGVIPSTGDNLNLFALGIGDSGSGKSSARRLFDRVTQEVFAQNEGWHLGTNASPEALQEKLIERDGKVSVFMGDEAHGWFKTVNANQWADGTYERIAEWYDGHVSPILRTTKRDLSGKSAKTYFLVHLMGTMKGDLSITHVLQRSMFFSGFLPRFTWYIGDNKPVTRQSLAESNGDGEFITSGFEPMARQWAAEFENTRKQLRTKTKRKTIPMVMEQDALERLTDMKEDARKLAQARGDWELLEPCLIRIGPNVRRAASLLALEDGRHEVTLLDTLCAIEQGEEWLSNLFVMAERVSQSDWQRQTDEIDTFIQGKGGQTRYETLYTKFASRRKRDFEEQVGSLIAQGRVREFTENGKKYFRANARMEESNA